MPIDAQKEVLVLYVLSEPDPWQALEHMLPALHAHMRRHRLHASASIRISLERSPHETPRWMRCVAAVEKASRDALFGHMRCALRRREPLHLIVTAPAVPVTKTAATSPMHARSALVCFFYQHKAGGKGPTEEYPWRAGLFRTGSAYASTEQVLARMLKAHSFVSLETKQRVLDS